MLWFILSLSLCAYAILPVQPQFQIEPKNLYLNKTTEKNESIDFFGIKKNIHAQNF